MNHTAVKIPPLQRLALNGLITAVCDANDKENIATIRGIYATFGVFGVYHFLESLPYCIIEDNDNFCVRFDYLTEQQGGGDTEVVIAILRKPEYRRWHTLHIREREIMERQVTFRTVQLAGLDHWTIEFLREQYSAWKQKHETFLDTTQK